MIVELTVGLLGEGFTEIANFFEIEQLPLEAVTVIFAVIAEFDVVLVAVKDGILPEPLEANPICILSFTQEILPLELDVEILLTTDPLQNIKPLGTDTIGVGLITIGNEAVEVPHSFATFNEIVGLPVVEK